MRNEYLNQKFIIFTDFPFISYLKLFYLLFMKLITYVIIMLSIAVFELKAQPCIPVPPFSSSQCNSFNASAQVISTTPICYRDSITIELKTDIQADSIHINYGDGTIVTVVNPPTLYHANHYYNLTPSDSCPSSNPLNLNITTEFYKCCASGFSYQTFQTSVSVGFRPRLDLSTIFDTLCQGQNFSLNLNGCHNGYTGHPATITIDYGDSTTPVVFSNLLNAGFPVITPHVFNFPSTHYTTVEITNSCGSTIDSVKSVSAGISSVQINPNTACTGIPVNATIYASNAGNYNLNVTTNTGAPPFTITGQGTSQPQITFQNSGTYTLHFSIGSPPICPVDCVVTVMPGPDMSFTHKISECFTGTNVYSFATSFFGTNPSQNNSFTLIAPGGNTLFNTHTSGMVIPAAAIALPDTGLYFAIDSSFTSCPGFIVKIDSFYILPQTILPNFGNDTVCTGTILTLPAAPTGTTINLNGTPYSSGTYNFNTPNTTTIFTYTPSCGSSNTYAVYVNPAVAFSVPPVSVCSSTPSISLNASPGGGNYSGMFVSGNIFNVSSAGTGSHKYYYDYTDIYSCDHNDSNYVTVSGLIVPNFTATSIICDSGNFLINSLGSSIVFNNTTYTDFMSVNLNNPGYYNYSIFGNSGCSDTIIDSVWVNSSPINSILTVSPDTGCNSQLVNITNGSSISSNTNYLYTLPDLTTTTTNPVNYNCILPLIVDSSNFIFILTASSTGCPSKSDTEVVKLYRSPTATFTVSVDTVCPADTVQFFYNVKGAPVDSVNWYIDHIYMGNNLVFQKRTFLAINSDVTYLIELIVFSKCGTDTIYHSVVSHPDFFNPDIHSDNSHYCQGEPIDFSSSLDSLWIYVWRDNRGHQFLGTNNFSIAYDSVGTINMFVDINSGCTIRTASTSVIIDPNPIAEFSTAQSYGCTGISVQLVNTSSIASAYDWDFGDGSPHDVLNVNPKHNFILEGTYNINLVAKNIYGCEDTTTQSIIIHKAPEPIISFNDTSLCVPADMDLSQVNLTVSITPLEYTWNGTIYGNPVLSFLYPDTLRMTLVASDSFCSNSAEAIIRTMPKPIADFTFVLDKSTDISMLGYFKNLSKTKTDSLIYVWSFGDGDSSNEENPKHNFRIAQIWNVGLYVINKYGCKDITFKEVDIDANSTIFIPNTFTPNGDGVNDNFQIYTLNIKEISGGIYDRWGLKLFEFKNIEDAWDGTYNGSFVQSDVYVYKLETVNTHGEDKEFVGRFTITR